VPTGSVTFSNASFKPAWWLPGPHLQTLWPNLLRRLPPIELCRERLELPDGDFLDLDWTSNSMAPIAVVLHGLEGSSGSHYAAGIMNSLQQHGWRVVLMHFRGCSGTPNRLPRGYHAGETGDLDHVVSVIRGREPGTPVAVVGFSLGGNVLLKWLGEQGAQAPIVAAAAVSVPFDLGNAADKLNRGLSRIYQWVLLRRMRKSMRSKWHAMGRVDGQSILDGIHSLRDFDERITAPLHGFSGAEDYYVRCSSRRFLKNIQVPTLILHAQDDPFMTPQSLPMTDELSSNVCLTLTQSGGHVGFISGSSPWRACYYAEQYLPAFLNKHL
jgi:uncharacterized protein